MFLKVFDYKYLLSALQFHVTHVYGTGKTFCCCGGDFLRLKHLIHAKKNTFLYVLSS